MPGFTLKSAERIAHVVRKAEAEGIDLRTLAARDRGQPGWQWFLLTDDFDADRLAPAKYGRWAASENDGDGELSADPIAWTYVRDTTGQSNASEGSWVMCRPIGSENGTVWEIVTSTQGFDRITGLTTAAVTGGNFNIDNVSVIRGADPREDTSSTSETVAIVNTMGWDADDDAHVFAEWNETSSTWVAYQVECPA